MRRLLRFSTGNTHKLCLLRSRVVEAETPAETVRSEVAEEGEGRAADREADRVEWARVAAAAQARARAQAQRDAADEKVAAGRVTSSPLSRASRGRGRSQ